MKKILLPLFLLLFIELSYGQTNYYCFNNDSLITENSVQLGFETMMKTIPDNSIIVPTIYHRIIKNDSIINYLLFVFQKCDSCVDKEFKLTFKQDSLFLLLGKKLPEFKLFDIEGIEFSSTQLKGKPTLINFWNVNCTPCIAEFPELCDLKNKYDTKMNFIGITNDSSKKIDLKGFLEKKPFNFRILENGEAYKELLKISGLPRNIFIDKDGYVRYIQGGFPYKVINRQNGTKEYDLNNYFVRIIEELIKKQ